MSNHRLIPSPNPLTDPSSIPQPKSSPLPTARTYSAAMQYTNTMEYGDERINESQEPAAVAWLHSIDRQVDNMRKARELDPDTLSDKVIKAAVPAIAGLVAGQVFQLLWDRGPGRFSKKGEHTRLAMSLVFAACSAAFGAVITQLFDRGTQSFVARRQRKRNR